MKCRQIPEGAGVLSLFSNAAMSFIGECFNQLQIGVKEMIRGAKNVSAAFARSLKAGANGGSGLFG